MAKDTTSEQVDEQGSDLTAAIKRNDTADNVKRITVSKDDIKERYAFNRKPEDYRNRRKAVIEIRGNKASFKYRTTKANHRYPDGGGPDFSLSPKQFVNEPKNVDYPARYLSRDQVAEEFPELDRGSEAFQERVDAWHETWKKSFWNNVEWKQEIELNPNQKKRTGLDKVIVVFQIVDESPQEGDA